MIWVAVLAGSLGCYLVKLLGLSVPQRVLASARTQRVATLLPVALLAALALTQTLTSGHRIVVDARLPALLVALAAIALRAPFLLVVTLAAATAALLRLVS